MGTPVPTRVFLKPINRRERPNAVNVGETTPKY